MTTLETKTAGSDDIASLWSTCILLRRFPDHERWRDKLRAVVDTELARTDAVGASRYASTDDLLQRYSRAALKKLFAFISDAVFDVAHQANAAVWPGLAQDRLRVGFAGAWFQVSNAQGGHDIHTHGNCSWSGVYYLEVDREEIRTAHPTLGPENGVTRLYGPHFDRLGGAAMDLGNAYLQKAHVDVAPEEGMLLVFPSWLPHRALPYDGKRDRVVFSFNARLHGASGDQAHPFGF
ncbi:MAG: putative 2OG-Fe(II) oxygenase [Myxococcota bacterium]